MKTRAAIIWGAVGACWLLSSAVHAQSIPTSSLVQPSDLFQITTSPSGSRVGGLRSTGGQVVLLISNWQDGQLRPVVSSYYLGGYLSVDSYRWLTDDYLLLQVNHLVDGWQTPVVVGIRDNTWRPLPVFTQLLKYPWGDANHALLQESGPNCRNQQMAFCLFDLNVNHWGGERITEPLRMLPADFLALPSGEIYASGRKVFGRHAEYRLSGMNWQRVPDGTFAQQQAKLASEQAPAASMLQSAAHVGIHHPTFVFTEPSHQLVGVIGQAPEAAFVALDHRLEGVQNALASYYPGARVSVSGLDDALTRGQFRVWDTDLPPTTFFLRADGALVRYAPGTPHIQADRLGRTHMELTWTPGDAVAVTLPPLSVALVGAVVIPVLAPASALQDPLHDYRPQVQAFAQQGIAVVQVLSAIPDKFASDAEGAAWRAALDEHLQQAVDHASSELAHGRPVCLYGEDLAGELALSAGLSNVGCSAALDPILNASELSKDLVTGLPADFAFRLLGPTTQMLDQNFPAAFGNAQGRLDDSRSWAARLPGNVMLAYDVARYADASRGYTEGDFAYGSAAFRKAVHRAGKHLDYYTPYLPLATFLQRRVPMIDAVTRYVHDYCVASAAAAAKD